jgi:hypothetical protein
MVAVQVETDRLDVSVPDAIATERRNYPPGGLAFDLRNGLATADTIQVTEATMGSGWLGMRPIPARRKETLWNVILAGTSSNPSLSSNKSFEFGPTWVHTRIPVPVRPGQRVRMSGKFWLSGTGTQEQNSNDNNSIMNAKVVLWGIGRTVDEYGVETDLQIPLQTWIDVLQTTTGGTVRKTFTIPAMSDVVVPANVQFVHLSIALQANATDEYQAGNYTGGGALWLPKTSWLFQSPKITNTVDAPLRIHISEPIGAPVTTPAVPSSTGWAFTGRTLWPAPAPTMDVTLVAGAAQTVQVYAHTGTTRGALLTTVNIPAGGRVTTTVTPPSTHLELVSASTVYAESVLPSLVDTLTTSQTRTTRYTYTDVTGPAVRIVPELVEADLAVTTIRFVSDAAADLLRVGKRVRILGLHQGGGYTTMITGTIRGRRVVHDFNHQAQIEVSVHSEWGTLGNTPCPAAFETVGEYSPILTRAGIDALVDGVEYSGPAAEPLAAWEFFPSYYQDGQDLAAALLATRNTEGAYLFVDRLGRVVYTTTPPTSIALEVSDLPGQGDMSYGRDIEFAADTDNVVNVIEVAEKTLARKSFVEGRIVTSDDPPMKFGPIASQIRRRDYRRESSVALYGTARRTIDIVRGSGRWEDIAADVWGTDFTARAAEILDQTATETTQVRNLTLIVHWQHVAKVAALQPLDAVVVRFQGQAQVARIRTISHDIQPGKWRTTIGFVPVRNQTLWTPPAPPIPTPPVDGGTVAGPGPGSIDGGNASTPGFGVIDGQEYE